MQFCTYFFIQNSSFGFCIESFVTENGSTTVPIFDPSTGKFKSQLECVSIPVSLLDQMESKKYLKNIEFDVPWDVLEQMYINFTVRTTTFRQMGPTLGED
jgi:hypothetical protein